MRLFLLSSLVLSPVVFANPFEPVPINDSCAMGISVSGCSFQYCDNGILLSGKTKTPQCGNLAPDLNAKDEIKLSRWHELISSHLRDGSGKDKFENDMLKVPNDSCAVGFYVSQNRYLKCDNGYFEKSKGVWSEMSPKKWDEAVSRLILSSTPAKEESH